MTDSSAYRFKPAYLRSDWRDGILLATISFYALTIIAAFWKTYHWLTFTVLFLGIAANLISAGMAIVNRRVYTAYEEFQALMITFCAVCCICGIISIYHTTALAWASALLLGAIAIGVSMVKAKKLFSP